VTVGIGLNEKIFEFSKGTDGNLKQYARYVHKYVHPFSITSGMSHRELKSIFKALKIPYFYLLA
jgi:hypothetical protein